MSGGHFDYQQYNIQNIADDVEQLIESNDGNYSEETIVEFKRGLEFLRLAYIYAKRIDWLVSGDDGEETFHKRLKDEIETYMKSKQ